MPDGSDLGRDRAVFARMRGLLAEAHGPIPPQERSPAGSPATPAHPPARRLAYAMVAVVVGTTAGLGNALVAANLSALGEALAVGERQIAWVSTAYVMSNISANLLLIKFRQQFGLRRFALLFLALHAALSLAHVVATDLWLALAVRAASGFVSAALIPLCLFYMMQAFPAAWRLKGLVLGLGVTQCSVPLARLLSPSLLSAGGGASLYLLESGFALLSLALVGWLQLPPAERIRAFNPLDPLIFLLMGGGLALVAAVLGVGRSERWFEAAWIAPSLGISIVALLAGATIDARRTTPLLNIGWLGRGDVARFAAATLLARMVLAEQGVALDLARDLGATSDQIGCLAFTMFMAAAGGAVVSAASANGEKLARPMMLATGIVAIAALADSMVHAPADLTKLCLSQAAIAFASVLFLGPALVLGITSGLRHGSRELISFIVLFGVVNSLGGLAGSVLLDSYIDVASGWHGATLPARRGALGMVAVLAGLATAYLGVLLLLRIRRELAENRAGSPAAVSGEPDAPVLHWRAPPTPATAACLLGGVAGMGIMLLLMAWNRIPVSSLQ